ncbi:hypothetical protein COLO4_28751 [Corchorus olitorius]|uniref:Serine-threonine/tyrosine-protein kinase catalytic domain-containing protein n=1 Tax=Corchorus olitorius TaxID=93759 RepID=A0A1R3HIF3_9ROSI|nr:hypothetical protein COLO4_28751 [Corchorus olitorius]
MAKWHQNCHPYIVKLIGYCVEHGQHLVVYEFVRNLSLDDALHNEAVKPLSWELRLFLALGIARALDCCPQGDHGDEAFGQPEFTNGSVSFTVNDNIEAVNLEGSADACDYWNKLFSELEDFSDLEELLNECT